MDLSLLALGLAAWRTLNKLVSLGLNIIIHKMGEVLPVKPTALTLVDLLTSGLRWPFLLLRAPWNRALAQTDPQGRALERGERDSVILLLSGHSSINSAASGILPCSHRASSAHLLRSRQFGGGIQDDSFSLSAYSLLQKPPSGKPFPD